MLMMLPFEAPTIFEGIHKSYFRMPRVVKDQRQKFENDDLFRQLAHESAVKYTGFKDRPLEERQMKFMANCQEGHTEVSVVQSGNQFTLMFNPTANPAYNNEGCDFDKDSGKVHIKSGFILNGVCVLWKGWIDWQRLEGFGCLEFDEYRAYLEDAMAKQQIDHSNGNSATNHNNNNNTNNNSNHNHHNHNHHHQNNTETNSNGGLVSNGLSNGTTAAAAAAAAAAAMHHHTAASTVAAACMAAQQQPNAQQQTPQPQPPPPPPPPVSLADAAHYGNAAIAAAAAAAFHQALAVGAPPPPPSVQPPPPPHGLPPLSLPPPPQALNVNHLNHHAHLPPLHLPPLQPPTYTRPTSRSPPSNTENRLVDMKNSKANNGATKRALIEEQTQLEDVDVVSDHIELSTTPNEQQDNRPPPSKRIFKSDPMLNSHPNNLNSNHHHHHHHHNHLQHHHNHQRARRAV